MVEVLYSVSLTLLYSRYLIDTINVRNVSAPLSDANNALSSCSRLDLVTTGAYRRICNGLAESDKCQLSHVV